MGLPANGVTSPWNTGESNESKYAQAIGNAQWRVHQRATTWYFLHVVGKGTPQAPSVTFRNSVTGQVVVSVPAMTNDPFWDTQRPMSNSRLAARSVAKAGVDGLRILKGELSLAERQAAEQWVKNCEPKIPKR